MRPCAGTDPLAAPSSVGNPISLFTGSKRQVETDVVLPGSELAFRRFYNSANEAYRSGMGQGWSHTYAVALFATPDGARELLQSDGRRLHFAPAGPDEAGRQTYRTGSAFEGMLLTTAEGEHRRALPDGRRLRFTGSYLVEIDWPDQRRLTLHYRRQRLISVTLPDGALIEYGYDERGNLTRPGFADGTPREYHYENDAYASHLTGLTDRTGVRSSTWAYDERGRLSEATITGDGTAIGTGTIRYAHDDTDRLIAVRHVGPDGTITPVERREYATGIDLEPSRVIRPSVNPDEERVTMFERDARGRVVSVIERGWSLVGLPDAADAGEADGASGYVPIERTVRYGYERGALVTIDGPRDDVEDIARFEYDELNRLIAIATPLSPTLRMSGFDAQGRVTRFAVGTQSPVSVSYAPNGRPALMASRSCSAAASVRAASWSRPWPVERPAWSWAPAFWSPRRSVRTRTTRRPSSPRASAIRR